MAAEFRKPRSSVRRRSKGREARARRGNRKLFEPSADKTADVIPGHFEEIDGSVRSDGDVPQTAPAGGHVECRCVAVGSDAQQLVCTRKRGPHGPIGGDGDAERCRIGGGLCPELAPKNFTGDYALPGPRTP